MRTLVKRRRQNHRANAGRSFGKRDRDRILVHVKADIVIDLSKTRLLCMRLGAGTPGATLDMPAYCETGRPISGEHVV
jgi:hypothetical protein